MEKNIFILTLFLLTLGCSKKIHNIQTDKRVLKKGTLMEMNSEDFLTQNNTWHLQTADKLKLYFDKSIAKPFREEVIKAQRKNYNHIVDLMGIKENNYPKVTYFLFKDKEQKKLLTQVDSDAHAIASNVYHLPKNAKGGQEIGHIITQTVWGFIPNDSEYALLIDEGFNYYIDNNKFYQGKLDDHTKEFFSSNKNFNIEDLTKNGKGRRFKGGHSREESYVAGSFVKFLIQNYGTEKFGELWSSAVNNKRPNFSKIYNKTLNELGIEFKNNLK